MMMTCDRPPPTMTKQLCTLAFGAFALVSLPAAAHAEDGVFGSVLKNFGLGSNNPIEYRERPPLVVPQTHDLPPPQASGRTRDPNWPSDAKSGARATRSDQLDDLDRLAVPQQPPPPGPATTATAPKSPPSPGFFERMFTKDDIKGATPANTPSRKTLIQPPTDYEETARPTAPENPNPAGPPG
jgi:hypothetical protein